MNKGFYKIIECKNNSSKVWIIWGTKESHRAMLVNKSDIDEFLSKNSK